MSRRLIAFSCLLALLMAGGCSKAKDSQQPAPQPVTAPRVGIDSPIPNPSKADLEQVRSRLATDPGLLPGDPDIFARTALPDLAAARKAFEGALFPEETAGRALVGIVYTKARSENVQPRQRIDLVYEGGLIIGARIPPPRYLIDLTRETTAIADSVGTLISTPGGAPGRPPTAQLNWSDGRVSYSITGYGLTEAEVVRIARSMKP